MSEKHIQQVLEIEKQAQEIQEKAKREAHEIPVKAEREAQDLIAKARSEAQEEARRMIAAIRAGESSDPAVETASADSDIEAKAKSNFNRAVAFVMERVVGGS